MNKAKSKTVRLVVTLEELEKLTSCRDINLADAGEDYFAGLYNGMELVLSCIEKREPIFFRKTDVDPKIKKKLIAKELRDKIINSHAAIGIRQDVAVDLEDKTE